VKPLTFVYKKRNKKKLKGFNDGILIGLRIDFDITLPVVNWDPELPQNNRKIQNDSQ